MALLKKETMKGVERHKMIVSSATSFSFRKTSNPEGPVSSPGATRICFLPYGPVRDLPVKLARLLNPKQEYGCTTAQLSFCQAFVKKLVPPNPGWLEPGLTRPSGRQGSRKLLRSTRQPQNGKEDQGRAASWSKCQRLFEYRQTRDIHGPGLPVVRELQENC
ncbi:hypothetical protein BDZ45DRAFT_753994 [Acephala macrosclerotiorum]|nr:hypothetical protein BDZ45DRAFT_753994 [Acephala macrosclerotiorum]